MHGSLSWRWEVCIPVKQCIKKLLHTTGHSCPLILPGWKPAGVCRWLFCASHQAEEIWELGSRIYPPLLYRNKNQISWVQSTATLCKYFIQFKKCICLAAEDRAVITFFTCIFGLTALQALIQLSEKPAGNFLFLWWAVQVLSSGIS